MSLRTRIARLEARIPRADPEGTGAPNDPLAVEEMMRVYRAMGSDHVREFAASRPEFGEGLAPVIAALDEWEATTPGWWLEGPWGQRRWRYGVRGRGEGGEDGA